MLSVGVLDAKGVSGTCEGERKKNEGPCSPLHEALQARLSNPFGPETHSLIQVSESPSPFLSETNDFRRLSPCR
jgi:hypothetical protein